MTCPTHRSLLLLVALLVGSAPVLAKPAHKQTLAEYFGPLLDRRLVDCRTCHLPEKPGEEESSERPHNPFGARLKQLREEWRKAGKSVDLALRLDAIAQEDSDGDGTPNFLELLAGRSPGDGKEKPTTVELSRAQGALKIFQTRREAYAWRPFEPVRRPPVPTPTSGNVSERNPIDAFLAVEHAKQKLTPRPEAPRHVLLRRLFLDLTGLPPTPEEQRVFLSDNSSDAYEKLVNRLLDSPRHGERWGRHWMDVWRYSDWAGYGAEVRESQPHIWRWRDWIVESLNADKGYDQMVREMLAGDELAPTDPSTLRATGFLARNWYIFNRNTWLDTTVEHTAKAFLGVTINCARCHDHFYDAISQDEYYQFRAFFEPYAVRTDRLPGQPDRTKSGVVRVYDALPEAPTLFLVRGNEANPDKGRKIVPGVPTALSARPVTITEVALPTTAVNPDKQEFVIREEVALAEKAVAVAKEAFSQAQRRATAGVAGSLPSLPSLTMPHLAAAFSTLTALELAEVDFRLAEKRLAVLKVVVRLEQMEDSGQKSSDTWTKSATEATSLQRQQAVLEARKNLLAARQVVAVAAAAKKAEAGKKVTEAQQALTKAEAALAQPATTKYTARPMTYPRARMSYGEAPANTPYPRTSTGRRLALAKWISDPKNPLTARVAMNQIWMRHFGRPLVATVFDFGRNGQPPSHPALLDWLADEFMRRGWSMKEMHRLIVLSQAYRRDSTPDADCATIDPDNQWLWRMSPRRLEAESVRDAVLHVAGGLDLTIGGPDLDEKSGLTTARRSLYYRHAAEKQMEFLRIFDVASVTECYRRTESVVPQQALALANSPLVLSQARLLARKLLQTAPEEETFVRAGFETVLAREPTSKEREECRTFLREQTTRLSQRGKLSAFTGGPGAPVAASADPAVRAREDLVQVLMNHNEFVTIR